MGSPLGPLLADIYVIENLAGDLIAKVPLYKRYVDDIIVIYETHEDMACLLNGLNAVQTHISLTCEKENNNPLPFLDILISRREDGSIRRSVYRKPTWVGQYRISTVFVQSIRSEV
ncbi:unnamed protein product [Heterobilharzia americana]|nr:unnamed protein product [Heterobilharzia americana]